MDKIKVGIIGGAGYTGGELVRLLLNHERAEIAYVQSRSQAGLPLHEVHTDLRGVTSLKFIDLAAALQTKVDLIFLALSHGEARTFLDDAKIADSVRVIDLSQDFRLATTATFGTRKFVYGLPELKREQIQKANSIANPGCFATAIQLALLPLTPGQKLKKANVTGITGSTGAGKKLTETSHFSFRSNNIQAYKTLSHQHVAEVEENLKAKVSFIPWRGDFTRGIFVSAVVEAVPGMNKAAILELYRKYYEGHPFISITDEPIDLKSIVNTNRALIEIHQEGSDLVIHSAIDNLLKGASGQAVQNLNLMMGFPETMGLKLKGVAF